MNKEKKVKNIQIYLSPMLPTKFSKKEREQIRKKEKELFMKMKDKK